MLRQSLASFGLEIAGDRMGALPGLVAAEMVDGTNWTPVATSRFGTKSFARQMIFSGRYRESL